MTTTTTMVKRLEKGQTEMLPPWPGGGGYERKGKGRETGGEARQGGSRVTWLVVDYRRR